MAMLQTFNLKGNKQSFADWISNLSPCETPFISMIGKEKTDQVQYSWQTDYLSKPDNTAQKEGSAPVAGDYATGVTTVHTNFTQIFRKAVRVADTTKKIGLYGRASELAYQMEKAGMEIKRDVEHALLNSSADGRPGTAGLHGIAAGVQKLVAAAATKDPDSGAEVRKVVTYIAGANIKKFTQLQVFDLTFQLYLAGSRANKVMVHPSNMWIFSDWIGDNVVTPHVHRMFDGMDTKYNAHVSAFRDPLGQVFDIIPNRYMPTNQLFFFNEADWTQMVLREPEKTELAKTGSSEKHMIEMEVGLRHRNPFASGILEFNLTAVPFIREIEAVPGNILADNTVTSTVTAKVATATTGAVEGSTAVTFTASTVNDDGQTAEATVTGGAATADGVATATVKHTKGSRVKVKAKIGADGSEAFTTVDTYLSRD
ncbi:MAG: SU10 major capsid protein [Bacteroidales bacterium]